MSQENIELVRQGFEMWNEGDVEGMLVHLSEDFEYVPSGLVPGLRSVYRGHQGWRDYWREFREVWQSLKIEVNEVREVDNLVVVLLTQRARGRDGVAAERQYGNVIAFRNDGLITRIQAYGEWSTALEAAGLSE